MSFTVLVIWFPRICIKLKLKVYLCECKEYLCISDFKGSQLVDMSLLWHITCWSSCQTTAPCNWVSLTGDLENMGQSLCKFLSWHWLLYLYVKFQQFSIIGRIMKTTLSKATLRKFWVSDQRPREHWSSFTSYFFLTIDYWPLCKHFSINSTPILLLGKFWELFTGHLEDHVILHTINNFLVTQTFCGTYRNIFWKISLTTFILAEIKGCVTMVTKLWLKNKPTNRQAHSTLIAQTMPKLPIIRAMQVLKYSPSLYSLLLALSILILHSHCSILAS